MNKLLRYILLFAFCSYTSFASAQDTPEMADVMRSNGKIYVVMAVCLIILVGLFLYVWVIDRKVTKLEKENINIK